MQNYDSRGSKSEHDYSQKSKEKPDSPAEGLIAGLGDAEGSKEGGCEGFQDSHGLMVLGWIPEVCGWTRGGAISRGSWCEGGKESTEGQEHPIGNQVVACCNQRAGLDCLEGLSGRKAETSLRFLRRYTYGNQRR